MQNAELKDILIVFSKFVELNWELAALWFHELKVYYQKKQFNGRGEGYKTQTNSWDETFKIPSASKT